MARKDYDEIKNKFEIFVQVWKSKETDLLDDIIDKEIKCYLSTAKAYLDGSQHTIFGVKNFIKDMPQADVFHTRICNYVCRLKDEEAHQTAHVVTFVGKYGKLGEEPLWFTFNAMFSNHWRKKDDQWQMCEMRMDLLNEGGNFEEFIGHWYFDQPIAKTYQGVHLPCINGELDSPWVRIPETEDVQTDEEKIIEAFSRYAFGIDHLVFQEVGQAVTEDTIADIEPWGSMDKRSWITSLKFHRQKDRHWGHPGYVREINIKEDTAQAVIYRMTGHRQREHAYQYTNENLNVEHACAMYRIKFEKVDGIWKIKRCNYYLGLIELGKFED